MMTQPAPSSPTTPIAQTSNRFEAIDGLRAVACIAVICHHCFVHVGRYTFPEFNLGIVRLSLPHGISYGYLGVEIFFVLSAFCLGYPLLAKDKPFVWGEYLYRRAIRILPPYFVTYLLLVLIGLGIRLLHAEPFYTAGFLQANLTDTIYGFFLRYGAYNGSFWTLCIEARWYFVLPLLIFLLRRRGWFVVFAVCCVIAVTHGFFREHHTFAHSKPALLLFESLLLLPLYLPTFALGLLVAQLAVHNPPFLTDRRFIGLVRTVFLITCVSVNFFLPIVPNQEDVTGRIVIGSLIAFTLLLMSLFDPVVRRWLSQPLLVTLGIASYSIYLIHEPIIHALYFLTKPFHWSEPVQFLFYQIVLPPLLLLIGYGFFYLVERQLLEWQKQARAKPPKTL